MEMTDPIEVLAGRFAAAIEAAFGSGLAGTDPLIKPAQNPRFGDFQANFAMALGKRVGKSPRDVAATVLAKVKLDDMCETPEVAGPGFVNLRLKSDILEVALGRMDGGADLGVDRHLEGHRLVVDLVGVNVAKQMHVGHLRSAIIGDCFARVLRRLGAEVIPQNHLGDWGLQIAMVLTELRTRRVDLSRLTLDELEQAYRGATARMKADARALATARRVGAGSHRIAEWEEQVAGAEAAEREAKATLLALQRGEREVVADWERLIAITMEACYEIYDFLDLSISEEHNRGESFYRDELAGVVDEFLKKGVAEESEGAVVVRIEGDETPLIIRKSDGAYLYATTDLAAIRYRVQRLGGERVVYVVDARQRDHFRKVFAAAGMIGWDRLPGGRKAELVHMGFGSVCGTDGKPLKTRSGENVKLKELLLEAMKRAGEVVREKNPELSAAEQEGVARAVGIGAVKYADLSTHLVRDYVFSWERMLAFEGNTGAYLQNQYVRIRSIARKAPPDVNPMASFSVSASEEKALALALLKYPGVVRGVGESLEPHRLCQYLYELAGAYSVFYTNCPVLAAESKPLRDGRLRLCNLTAKVLADGLGLLGIRTLERM